MDERHIVGGKRVNWMKGRDFLKKRGSKKGEIRENHVGLVEGSKHENHFYIHSHPSSSYQ